MRSGETLTLRDDRVTGLAIRFGGRHEKDRTGEWFSEATELYLDHYVPGAPVWLSHNFDYDRLAPLADASPIGVMESYQVTPVGVWITSRLTLPHNDARYGPLVEALLGNAMKYSSDSIQHIVRPHVGPDGHVAVWPLAGLSIVDARHAAEPRQPPLAAKAFDAALKAAFPAETAQRAPAGQLYLVQQHRTGAGKAQRASRPHVSMKTTSYARSEDDMKGKHAAKATIEQLNAVVGNAAEILGIEPTLDALVIALQAGPDPEAPMGEETAAKFNDLLAQMAELLGIPGDEVGVDDLITALTQLRGGAGQTEAKPPETNEQPPAKEPAQATQQTAATTQTTQTQQGQTQPDAAKATVQPIVPVVIDPAGLDAMIQRAAASAVQRQTPPQQQTEQTGATLSLEDIVNATAKAVAGQQRLTAPAQGVMPATGATALAAFEGPATRGPAIAAKAAWNIIRRRPEGPVSYKAIVKALIEGPDACKAVGMSAGEDGGFLLPVAQSQEIIGLLYDQMVATALGADYTQMTTQTMPIPKMLSGATAYYIGDNQEAQESQPTFGEVELSLKRLTAMTRVSNRWIRYSVGPQAERKIRDDLSMAVRTRQDIDVLRGTGSVPGATHSGSAPLGIRFVADVTLLELDALPTLEDLQSMVLTLQQNNIEDDGTFGWAMNPLTLSLFSNLKDADGNPVLRETWAEGPKQTLLGYPVKQTNAIPLNLGAKGTPSASGVYTEIHFGRWSDVVVGMGTGVEVRTTSERYWEFDQTGIRVDVDWDAVVFRAESFVVATRVRTRAA